MPEISIRNANHYYEWITDSPRLGTRPTMIFIHGWGGSSRYWQSTAQALKGEFDCLLYDLRGFGRSGTSSTGKDTEPYNLESYAEDLDLLLSALELDAVYLNAHSMGASIATYFLNLYPERVVRAILTCTGIFEYDERTFQAFYRFGSYVVRFRPPWLYRLPGVDRMFMARFVHQTLPGPIRQAFLEDFLQADEAAALGTIFTSVSYKATQVMPQEFSRLQVPTLIIAGEHDRIIPASMGEQAAKLNSLIKLQVMPNTAHFPMLEDSTRYLEHLRQFLASPPGPEP